MEDNTSKVFVGRADSLLAAAPANAPASTLFIINLCSSIAPVQTAGKTIPGFENHKLYQVARAEDGRTRHRLRLGFFTSEAEAETALSTVRDNYPTAFVTCLTEDDRRFARGFLPNSEMTGAWKRPTLVPKPEAPAPIPAPAAAAPAPAAKAAPPAPAKAATPAPVAKPAAEAAASKPAAPKPEIKKAESAPAPVAAKAAPAPAESVTEIEMSWDPPALTPAKQPAASPARTVDTVIKAKPAPAPKAAEAPKPATPKSEITLTLEKEPAAPAKPAAPAQSTTPAQPFHVGKGVEIPTSALSLESAAAPAVATPPAASKPAPAPAAQAAKPAAKSEPVRKAPETKPAAAAPATTQGRAPELDSTQTIRALTSAELNDDSQEKWYSIQLVVSERPVNLDAMPHLDIFEAYRVYSIANAGSGKIVYSLRLGFFREEVSAEAVTGYLRTFFPSPSVIRISAAEQNRFKDAPAPKATAAAKTDAADKVIDLDKARDRKPVVPTVTMEVADRSPTGAFKPSATGTFKVDASGKHKTIKPAAKSAAHATKRSAPLSKTSATGRHKALKPRSLQEQLLDEARNVQLSESAIRKLPKNDSLLSRLVGKLTK